VEECEGTTTTVALDATGSSDPEAGALSYAWSSDCPGASFDDASSATPVLTLDSALGCNVACEATVAVTDPDANTVECTASVNVVDTTDPVAMCPADLVLQCDQPTDPGNTGVATSSDVCDALPQESSVDNLTPGACPQAMTITRTWTATDDCGNDDSCDQVIDVVDTEGPTISCNAPATIRPPDAPISFTATAADNCDESPVAAVTAYDCTWTNGAGKVKSKLESCVVEFAGPTVTILDSGGVGDHISWTVEATDACGNVVQETCAVDVVKPGKGP
jgi:hypothetical protein